MRARRRISLLVLTAALLLALASGPHVGGAASQDDRRCGEAEEPARRRRNVDLVREPLLARQARQDREKARRYGIETVLIKSADGGKYWKQFSASLVSALKARGLNVCAWQFVYGRGAAKEARAGAAAVSRGADCLVIDVEGHYEGRYPQASTYMTTLRSIVGPDYPLALTSFPYVDYHPALPYSVFSGRAERSTTSRSSTGRRSEPPSAGFAHTWVWNRAYGRPILPSARSISTRSPLRSGGSARSPSRTGWRA